MPALRLPKLKQRKGLVSGQTPRKHAKPPLSAQKVPRSEKLLPKITVSEVMLPDVIRSVGLPQKSTRSAGVLQNVINSAGFHRPTTRSAELPSQTARSGGLPSQITRSAGLPSQTRISAELLSQITRSAELPSQITTRRSAELPSQTTRSAGLPSQITRSARSPRKVDGQAIPSTQLNHSAGQPLQNNKSPESLPKIGEENHLPRISPLKEQTSNFTGQVPGVERTKSSSSVKQRSSPLSPESTVTSTSASETENEVSRAAQTLIKAVEKKCRKSATKNGRARRNCVELQRAGGNINITINNNITTNIYQVKTMEMMAVNSTVNYAQEPTSTADVCDNVNVNDDDFDKDDSQNH